METTSSNVVYLDDFRNSIDQMKLESGYETYLRALEVSDLLHEAKISVRDIQNGTISLNHLTKAEKILKELSRRMTSLNTGHPLGEFDSLHLEIQNRIQNLQL